MHKTTFTNKHQDCLSAWAGFKVNLNDEFGTLVECDFDFIEIMLLFEKKFTLDLLETKKDWQDFLTVWDFVTWALERSAQEPIPYIAKDNSYCLSNSPSQFTCK